MWQTAQHQLERCEPLLQLPVVSWYHRLYTERCHIKHIQRIPKTVGTSNNIIRKLRNSKWGATPTTRRSSALNLSNADHRLSEVQQTLTVCPHSESPHHTSGERWQVARNRHGPKAHTQWTSRSDVTPGIAEEFYQIH